MERNGTVPSEHGLRNLNHKSSFLMCLEGLFLNDVYLTVLRIRYRMIGEIKYKRRLKWAWTLNLVIKQPTGKKAKWFEKWQALRLKNSIFHSYLVWWKILQNPVENILAVGRIFETLSTRNWRILEQTTKRARRRRGAIWDWFPTNWPYSSTSWSE